MLSQLSNIDPTRRHFLRVALGGSMGVCVSSVFDLEALGQDQTGDRAMILLWMNGGPSQIDTFDPKPGHANGGSFKPISTSVPGVQISEHLPKVAKQMRHLALIRSMTSKEGSHERGRYLMHTGYLPTGSVTHPSFGSIVSSELGKEKSSLPNFVSVALPSLGPGPLGMTHAAFHVPKPMEKVPNANVAEGIAPARFNRRLGMLSSLEAAFVRSQRGPDAMHHVEVYQKGVRLMCSPALKAFDLTQEKDTVRDAYGRSEFGQGCLLARRLVEAGCRCVQVSLNGWDTHLQNFAKNQELSGVLDPAMGTLLADLADRGRLENTLVVWMGEFGRTPRINVLGGRDHWPNTWTAAIAGAGTQGGTVVGKTSADGTQIAARKVTVPELFASFCHALRINPDKENYAPNGRPIAITNQGKPIAELFS